MRVAADAIRLTRRIVAAPALSAFKPVEYLPGPSLQTEEELHQAAARIGTTIFHPVGTCRMGQDRDAVVDAQLRVHGIKGLAHRRRLDHAAHHLGQHLLADLDDCREGGADDA